MSPNYVRFLFFGLIGCIVSWWACADLRRASNAPKAVSYNFHIRPILSDKCFKCHGPDANKREAGLRLDIAEKALAPLPENPSAYAWVPGHPERSEAYLRMTSADTSKRMPPLDSHLGALTDVEKALVKQWIEEGARYERHWAFIKPEKATLPAIQHKKWPLNEVDYFVAEQMEAHGLSPNDPADPARLLKRLSFDLTGLPPSPDLLERFLADNSPNAYEKAVDELLAMPQYGEQMAVQWLDVARYADSYGYQDDNIRTQWPWRDWVIHAFNQNLPYDQFLTWQLAGDMLPNATKEQILATAFLRNHKYTEEGGVIPEEYRITYLVDKTNTVSKGILGVTLECAQCHDHKYDPFTQADYFSMLAFFNNTKEQGYEGDVSVSKPAKTPVLRISDTEVKSILNFLNKRDTGTMMVSVMKEDTLRQTHLLTRGVYDQPAQVVPINALPAVMAFGADKYRRDRLGLAQWFTDRDNPLTARVYVNRIWLNLFGRGLVKTSGDFGMQGELPTHPALLDWLAVDFVEHGWNIKRLMKQLVMSATYRQSTASPPEQREKDPENIYLARGPRTRLSAELIRDMVLASSGLLNTAVGGPSVKPYQPKGLWESATSGRGVLARYVTDKGDDLYRRGLYTFIKLTVPPPAMMIFDGSNRDQCQVQRLQTNTPLQALVMMNDPTVLESSRVLAARLLANSGDLSANIDHAFRRILCRPPQEKERQLLLEYCAEQQRAFRENRLNARQTVQIGAYPIPEHLLQSNNVADWAALSKTIALLYNLEEAITKS